MLALTAALTAVGEADWVQKEYEARLQRVVSLDVHTEIHDGWWRSCLTQHAAVVDEMQSMRLRQSYRAFSDAERVFAEARPGPRCAALGCSPTQRQRAHGRL